MLSFIIPAYNEELELPLAIAAIRAAAAHAHQPQEIVVVDDASTDRTAEIAAGRGARVVPVGLPWDNTPRLNSQSLRAF